MFDTLQPLPDDPLLALIGLYRNDPRADTVDLGVGVYRDEAGRTPVMRAVKEAERRLVEGQESKSYLGLEGDLVFLDHLWALVAGDQATVRASAGVQTPGGSGALRLSADLAARLGSRRVHLGLPGWPNHAAIFKAAGLDVVTYPFFDIPTQRVLVEDMLAAFEKAEKGDAVLLHASCHNPSGAALSDADWKAVAEVVARRGLLPIIDIAYQGFGRGLEEDAAGLRTMISTVEEALICVSCSKSFGIYRDRTGGAFAVGRSAQAVAIARMHLGALARTSYSMPPDHGAAVVRTILADAALTADWKAELEEMRQRILGLRRILADGLRGRWQALGAIAEQEGMFSLLPLTEAQVLAARHDHGIYMPASGRINIAGLATARAADVVQRIASL